MKNTKAYRLYYQIGAEYIYIGTYIAESEYQALDFVSQTKGIPRNRLSAIIVKPKKKCS